MWSFWVGSHLHGIESSSSHLSVPFSCLENGGEIPFSPFTKVISGGRKSTFKEEHSIDHMSVYPQLSSMVSN